MIVSLDERIIVQYTTTLSQQKATYHTIHIKFASSQRTKCLNGNRRQSQGNAPQCNVFQIFPVATYEATSGRVKGSQEKETVNACEQNLPRGHK